MTNRQNLEKLLIKYTQSKDVSQGLQVLIDFCYKTSEILDENTKTISIVLDIESRMSNLVNNTQDQINNLITRTDTDIDSIINETRERIAQLINNTELEVNSFLSTADTELKDAITNIYNEIISLVNEHLSTIDIPSTVRTVMNEMKDDGTLDEIINQEIFSELNNSIEGLETSVNNINNSIANINLEISSIKENIDLISDNTLPIGSIVCWKSSILPSGFAWCDGLENRPLVLYEKGASSRRQRNSVEFLTGEVINGYFICEKYIDIAPSNMPPGGGSVSTVAHLIENIETILTIEGTYWHPTLKRYYPFGGYRNNSGVNIDIGPINITLDCNNDMRAYSGLLHLKYTRTDRQSSNYTPQYNIIKIGGIE